MAAQLLLLSPSPTAWTTETIALDSKSSICHTSFVLFLTETLGNHLQFCYSRSLSFSLYRRLVTVSCLPYPNGMCPLLLVCKGQDDIMKTCRFLPVVGLNSRDILEVNVVCRSQWPRGLRAAAHQLRQDKHQDMR
jgi:hypothetical protein